MGDPDEWDPSTTSFTTHLIAGAIAGTVEHCGMYPIDTIKTHIQARRPAVVHTGHHGASLAGTLSRSSTISAVNAILTTRGIPGLFRGLSAAATGAAPAHAAYFATYEYFKVLFGGNREGHQPIPTAAAGMLATIAADGIATPLDAVKQRMQLGVRPYTSAYQCGREVLRLEGWGALYAGYTTTLAMNLPYNAVYFASYESLRRMLKRGHESEHDALAHCLAGGGAGMLAAGASNPLDVARTRLQTQGELGVSYKGMYDALRQIWVAERWAGMARGMAPRMAFHSVSAALCWTTYEFLKSLLSGSL